MSSRGRSSSAEQQQAPQVATRQYVGIDSFPVFTFLLTFSSIKSQRFSHVVLFSPSSTVKPCARRKPAALEWMCTRVHMQQQHRILHMTTTAVAYQMQHAQFTACLAAHNRRWIFSCSGRWPHSIERRRLHSIVSSRRQVAAKFLL